MSSETVRFTAPLWRWEGNGAAAWYFVTAKGEAASSIEAHSVIERLETGRKRGFGSVKVTACVGRSEWSTSVFPSKGEGYLLPVKLAIRKAEDLAEGDEVSVTLTLL